MLTRLLLAGALGLTLATASLVSLDAHAQGFFTGDFSNRGVPFAGLGERRQIFESLILFDEGIVDLFTGQTQAGEADILRAEELLQAAVSETKSFR